MKKDFLPYFACLFLLAVFLVAAGAIFLFPSLNLSALPVFKTLPVFRFFQ